MYLHQKMHTYIIIEAAYGSHVVGMPVSIQRNYGFLYSGIPVSILRNRGVKSPGILKQSKPVIDIILQEQLVACVQEVGIQSHYVWKNEFCNDNEILIFMKTTNELYEVLKTRLLEIHPYETPEIVRIDISDGSTGYLSWIKEVTSVELIK